MKSPPSGARAAMAEGSTGLAERFETLRSRTEALAAPLSPEDQVVQSMPDCSPTKWHLAHVSWFFENFVLVPHARGYRVRDAAYGYLFNSYYEAVGARQPRHQRGLLTRPALTEVLAWRRQVTDALRDLLTDADDALLQQVAPLVELGIQHEQQHQELLLMDALHLLSCNPLRPAYRSPRPSALRAATPLRWFSHPGGVVEIGARADAARFAFDNETPRHEVLLRPFELASRAVTQQEWLEFIGDDGYRRPELWLADGWTCVQREAWTAPLYWERLDGEWRAMTLGGLQALEPQAPVAHVSFYEADAFARWRGARLPSEAEWEVFAAGAAPAGNFLDTGLLRPRAAPAAGDAPAQLYGDVWEWTASSYGPYPRFRPVCGAIGEYNGKFMCNQIVLRGGCCVTPDGHLRATYRNFFYPHQRWAFSGLRLARDA